jgi:hypothetical protein
MHKLMLLAILALALGHAGQEPGSEPPAPNPEMQRQEIINLENEAARAIQTNSGTFFRHPLARSAREQSAFHRGRTDARRQV